MSEKLSDFFEKPDKKPKTFPPITVEGEQYTFANEIGTEGQPDYRRVYSRTISNSEDPNVLEVEFVITDEVGIILKKFKNLEQKLAPGKKGAHE